MFTRFFGERSSYLTQVTIGDDLQYMQTYSTYMCMWSEQYSTNTRHPVNSRLTRDPSRPGIRECDKNLSTGRSLQPRKDEPTFTGQKHFAENVLEAVAE